MFIRTCVEEAVGDLVEDGFAVVKEFVNEETLALLQQECDLLHQCSDSTVRNGCILQPTVARGEQRLATVEAYCNHRVENCLHQNKQMARRVFSSLWEETKLKQAIDQIFGEQAYFYNEQYIVKPACDKRTQFLLHKDSDSLRNPPAYVSFWIALDDITRNNGGLQAMPYNPADKPIDLLVSKRDAVLLAHDVYHQSSSNSSDCVRRAYMISQLPIFAEEGNLSAFAARVER